MKRSWRYGLFAAYCLVMLWLLIGQRIGGGDQGYWQVVPFRTLEIFWNALRSASEPAVKWHAWKNLAGNVLLFIPLGLFVPWLWKMWRSFWRQSLLMAGLIMAVELTQLWANLGWCDVDDLILNMVGTSLGYLLWRCLHKRNLLGID